MKDQAAFEKKLRAQFQEELDRFREKKKYLWPRTKDELLTFFLAGITMGLEQAQKIYTPVVKESGADQKAHCRYDRT